MSGRRIPLWRSAEPVPVAKAEAPELPLTKAELDVLYAASLEDPDIDELVAATMAADTINHRERWEPGPMQTIVKAESPGDMRKRLDRTEEKIALTKAQTTTIVANAAVDQALALIEKSNGGRDRAALDEAARIVREAGP